MHLISLERLHDYIYTEVIGDELCVVNWK